MLRSRHVVYVMLGLEIEGSFARRVGEDRSCLGVVNALLCCAV